MVLKKTIFASFKPSKKVNPAYGRLWCSISRLLLTHLEAFQVIEVDPADRTVELGEPFTINGWTSFTFDGRQDTYNDFHWHWYHFTGYDYDAKRRKSGIYLIKGTIKAGPTRIGR